MYNITIVYKNGTTQKYYDCFDIHLDGIDIVFFENDYDSLYDRHAVSICGDIVSLVITNNEKE